MSSFFFIFFVFLSVYQCSIVERFTFSQSSQQICSNELQMTDRSTLIVVISYAKHFDYRQAIRSTWGQRRLYSKFQIRVRTVFFVGTDDQANIAVKNEQNSYGDVVQIGKTNNFNVENEHFSRLSKGIPENEPFIVFKDLASLYWTRKYCSNVRHIFRINDQYVLNIFRLLKFLQTDVNFDVDDVFYGLLKRKSVVVREGRWFVSTSEFSNDFYPSYSLRPTFLISNRTADVLIDVLKNLSTPILRINDVFLSGILRDLAKIPLKTYQSVETIWNINDQIPCDLHFEKQANLLYCPIKLYQIPLDQIEEFYSSWEILSKKFIVGI